MKINLLYVFAGTITILSGLFGVYAVKYGPYRELDAYMTETLERDKEYYDEEELESYITDHVADFTEKNGDTVEKVSFTVKEGIAKLQMEYDSCEAYTGFNGIELFHGTVVAAQAEGYDFDMEFCGVDAEAEEGKGKAFTKEDVLADDDNKVAVIKANIDVQVPGKILFVSAKDTKVTSKNTVSITGAGTSEEAGLTYIIYK